MLVLSVDPGGNNGYAFARFPDEPGNRYELLSTGTLPIDSFLQTLKGIGPELHVLVYEDWKTRPKEARGGAFDWDPMETIRVIGAIEFAAVVWGFSLVKQQANIKPVGYGFLGTPYKKGARGKHHLDAVAHLVYWGVKNKRMLPPSLEKLKKS